MRNPKHTRASTQVGVIQTPIPMTEQRSPMLSRWASLRLGSLGGLVVELVGE